MDKGIIRPQETLGGWKWWILCGIKNKRNREDDDDDDDWDYKLQLKQKHFTETDVAPSINSLHILISLEDTEGWFDKGNLPSTAPDVVPRDEWFTYINIFFF
jgi:hypothetical protein